ncbi:hypothetical protein AXFE_01310 [Acidithrix ferrooxidans]|uniref:Uncharacterized protein n=1 Tax=Acidithrix ferrooxidans TaxID=1280514 RepID=A0A0D8HML4_9ACTN|nr:hypothetical protein AXFE_01310 [Acidithrix ferrooxidans]
MRAALCESKRSAPIRSTQWIRPNTPRDGTLYFLSLKRGSSHLFLVSIAKEIRQNRFYGKTNLFKESFTSPASRWEGLIACIGLKSINHAELWKIDRYVVQRLLNPKGNSTKLYHLLEIVNTHKLERLAKTC